MAQNGLLDFLQGASNSAASTVSAPVDGLAWLLRKAGAKVGDNPIGGSDWMRANGLTQEPQNKLMGLLGEAAGGVSPMVAGAYAPQIARGLLGMADNAMAPRTMNKQAGAIVWHGSPHKFDKFDAGKIGTGEGAQAYGHGLYLAEAQDTAQSYANKLTNVDGRAISDQIDGRVRYLNMLKQQAKDGDINAAKNIPVMEKSLAELQNQGSLYKVDLPDEHIAKMLDWDKPLSQQHPDVQAALSGLQNEGASMSYGDMLTSLKVAPHLQNAKDYPFMHPTGKQIYDSFGDAMMVGNSAKGQITASDKLKELGIPGIRYLDGGSRGAGAGSSNFVVFPGNESLLNIMERNGQPVNAMRGLLGK